MKKFLRNPVLILCVLTIGILCIVFSKIIFHPNSYLLNTGGDAFKNYYTPAWFVANDEGIHFSGMHYPYGEHVVFTDNQPIISWIINFVDDHIVDLSGYTVGIMHILLMIGMFFCVFFIYKIMVFYALPPYFAIVASILIGLMNPQLDRLWGHFALGYALFIPMIWYLIILWKKNNYSWLRLFLVSAVILFFGFIHMYYILIGSMFLFVHTFVLIFHKNRNWKYISFQAIAAIMPVAIMMLFMHFTDTVHDRPESPFGFFLYKASFQSVFLPMEGSIKNQLTRIFHLEPSNAEGYAYVGITAFFFLFVFLFIYLKRLFYKRSIKKSFILLPGDLSTWLITSVLILLFSMTYPFKWNMEFLLDIITPLKQFRSPGRFAWIFYYVYTISFSVIIYMLYKKIKKQHVYASYAFLLLPLCVQVSDTYGYFVKTAKRMQTNNSENPFIKSNTFFNDMFLGTAYTANSFDAILFLPSFFQGSEKLYIDKTAGSLRQAMEISYQTRLPLVNYMMSRTSFSQTLNNVQIVSHPYIDITSEEGVFSADNILLVTVDNPFTAGEKYLIENANSFAKKSGFTFYDLKIDDIKTKGESLAIADYEKVKDSLMEFQYSGGTYYSEKALTLFYKNSFDELSSAETFSGTGSFISEQGAVQMAEIPVESEEIFWIEISFWAKSDIHTMAYPYIDVQFIDEKDIIIGVASVAPTLSTDIMHGWVRASENFEIQPQVKRIRISCSNDSHVNFDELVVRHTAYSVYYELHSPNSFWVNNFLIGN